MHVGSHGHQDPSLALTEVFGRDICIQHAAHSRGCNQSVPFLQEVLIVSCPPRCDSRALEELNLHRSQILAKKVRGSTMCERIKYRRLDLEEDKEILLRQSEDGIHFAHCKSARKIYTIAVLALCSKSNGSYVIKDFGTLPLIFSTSKYFRRKCQPCPSFFSHPNIPDK